VTADSNAWVTEFGHANALGEQVAAKLLAAGARRYGPPLGQWAADAAKGL
jgi:hypothetical protein